MIMTRPQEQLLVTDPRFTQEKFRLMFESISAGHWWSAPLTLVPVFYLYDVCATRMLISWAVLHFLYLVISYHWLIKPYDLEKIDRHLSQQWFSRLTGHNLCLGLFWAVLPFLPAGDLDTLSTVYIFVQIYGLVLGGTALLSVHFASYLS